jgi:hypothetical protein
MTLKTQSSIIETSASPEWIDTVREKLMEVWGQQACRCPEHWPGVCQRLLENLGPLVDDAVTHLARLFGTGKPISDPTYAVWRLFPRLDHKHCTVLANSLAEAWAKFPGQEEQSTPMMEVQTDEHH